ncbi:MAG: CoA transferase [Chloroflexi bacterium]|nr:CoA transferase [Chloroflexota bacterium]
MALPLEGVRVLDLTRMVAGPLATMLLADQGAEVIKIEEPGQGDRMRRIGTAAEFVNGVSLYWLAFNRNKKSVTINLKKDSGRRLFYQLVPLSNVVVHSFRPEAAKRIGVDQESLSRLNPQVISCSISGFGETGPYQHLPGFDPVIQALSGLASTAGEPGTRPEGVGLPVGDLIPGVCAAYSISAALYEQRAKGQGCHIDLAMLDCVVGLLGFHATRYLATGHLADPGSGLQVTQAPWGAFKASDGYLVVTVSNEELWAEFCKVIGCLALVNDPRFENVLSRVRHHKVLRSLIEEALAERTAREWVALLWNAGVGAAPVYSVGEALEDQHVQARDMVVSIEHPVAGAYRAAGTFIKTTRASQPRLEPPPLLGQHTNDILGKLLKLDENEIAQLRAEKAV